MEQLIYRELGNYNAYVAQSDADQVFCSQFPSLEITPQARNIEARRKMIECWMKLLTVDEYHIITLHLIDKFDWDRVCIEYKKLWGEEFGKSAPTLRKRQKVGIEKISAFAQEKERLVLEIFSG